MGDEGLVKPDFKIPLNIKAILQGLPLFNLGCECWLPWLTALSEKQKAHSYGHSNPVLSKTLLSELSITRTTSEHCSASKYSQHIISLIS